jgi:molecular chaperone GrpE (heat shock protein)
MHFPSNNPEAASENVSPPDPVETPALSEAAPETDAPLEQMLRHLRLREFSKAGDPTASDEAAALIESSELSAAEAAEADRESAAGDAVRAALAQVSAEMQTLAQEVCGGGRKVFKTNRAAESYQETCTAALAEIEQLSATVTQIPQQMETASLCRELLRVADALEASLTAADELLAQQAALSDATAAIRQWRDGQQLLYKRLLRALSTAGVQLIPARGQPFDPIFHRAVAAERPNDVPAGMILGEELIRVSPQWSHPALRRSHRGAAGTVRNCHALSG